MGQIWNAHWHDYELLVYVARLHPESAELGVWPVTLEPGVEGEKSVVIDAASSPLNADTVLWDGLARTISTRALERMLADLGPKTGEVSRALMLVTLHGARAGRELWSPPQAGIARAVADLEDTIDALADIPKPQRNDRGSTTSKLAIPLTTIIDALRIGQPRAMSIVIGKEPVSPAEALKLSEVSGIPVQEITAHVQPLPLELELELCQPRWRPLVQSYAEAEMDEDAARQTLGYEAYALAAREQGAAGRNLWRERLRAIARSKLESN